MTGKPIVFHFPRTVQSAKNRRKPVSFPRSKHKCHACGSRIKQARDKGTGNAIWVPCSDLVIFKPSDQAETDEKELRTLALRTAGGVRFDDDDVELRVRYRVKDGSLTIGLGSMGPKPRKPVKTGRGRDAHGMLELIADSLHDRKRVVGGQRVVSERGIMSDDSQIARVLLTRVYD